MWRFWLLFFFQAEDGIRDYKVTGVQTCALPISWGSAGEKRARERRPCELPRRRSLRPAGRPPGRRSERGRALSGKRRSEERRVGKECRSGWVAYDEKTTTRDEHEQRYE